MKSEESRIKILILHFLLFMNFKSFAEFIVLIKFQSGPGHKSKANNPYKDAFVT
uniref:Secreted ferritin G subunit n=1 Tax=Nostoc flagelliforme str. Sunitezuoqi TaxID=676037 RepID=E7DPL4_9NOSO|nr:secreted ferritin G subunit [Nostoc flagelliforme str. Sunitezuoqi]